MTTREALLFVLFASILWPETVSQKRLSLATVIRSC